MLLLNIVLCYNCTCIPFHYCIEYHCSICYGLYNTQKIKILICNFEIHYAGPSSGKSLVSPRLFTQYKQDIHSHKLH